MFFSQKEKDYIDLAIKLQNDGVITTLGVFFQKFDQKEILNLVNYSVFKFKLFNKNNYNRT